MSRLHRLALSAIQAAKQQQALFITLAHNLLLMLELTLEVEEGITDEKVRHKQQERLNQEARRAREADRVPNPFFQKALRATQRSLQFIRWLRYALRLDAPHSLATGCASPAAIDDELFVLND